MEERRNPRPEEESGRREQREPDQPQAHTVYVHHKALRGVAYLAGRRRGPRGGSAVLKLEQCYALPR